MQFLNAALLLQYRLRKLYVYFGAPHHKIPNLHVDMEFYPNRKRGQLHGKHPLKTLIGAPSIAPAPQRVLLLRFVSDLESQPLPSLHEVHLQAKPSLFLGPKLYRVC